MALKAQKDLMIVISLTLSGCGLPPAPPAAYRKYIENKNILEQVLIVGHKYSVLKINGETSKNCYLTFPCLKRQRKLRF